ncbi:hypothetical protein VIN01S_36680 [Vibrio inusitatus NBRC 102082]|uniref:Uncharacterized protein n=1 Tax=Vibrio inusitatus NBRC 102082 TaxID=1219070 RepID=A0A4Y3I340_9VIBR|nr:hypothetical protein VIN01S_36680 [Vibrio inusitatus NBRC 102082]
MIEVFRVENLIEVYIKQKYTKESHVELSHSVLSYLKKQGFMNKKHQ